MKRLRQKNGKVFEVRHWKDPERAMDKLERREGKESNLFSHLRSVASLRKQKRAIDSHYQLH
jgi:hypothetical protein